MVQRWIRNTKFTPKKARSRSETFKTWDFRGGFKEDFEWDFERDFERYFKGSFRGC